jgi:hypothetical protein
MACNNPKPGKTPLENYLRSKSVLITDTTYVVVMGCVLCSMKPSAELDSIMYVLPQNKNDCIFISTGHYENINQPIWRVFSSSNTTRIIVESEKRLQDMGLYHRNPKIFVVKENYRIINKRVITD